MNPITVIGIDLAKSVFMAYIWMNDGSIAFDLKVFRAKWLDIVHQFPAGSIIAKEACVTSRCRGALSRQWVFILLTLTPNMIQS